MNNFINNILKQFFHTIKGRWRLDIFVFLLIKVAACMIVIALNYHGTRSCFIEHPTKNWIRIKINEPRWGLCISILLFIFIGTIYFTSKENFCKFIPDPGFNWSFSLWIGHFLASKIFKTEIASLITYFWLFWYLLIEFRVVFLSRLVAYQSERVYSFLIIFFWGKC